MEAWVIVGTIGSVIAAIGTPFVIWSIVLAVRADRRSTEARDVVWSVKATDGAVTLAHEGSDAARGVAVSFTVNGETSSARFERVPPSMPVSVPSEGYAELVRESQADDAEYEREYAEWEWRRDNPAQGPGGIYIPFFESPPLPRMERKVQMSAVIAWTYRSGASDRQELRWTES